MIKSLEELALQQDFTREHWGDKSAALAEHLRYIDEQRFRCVKPSGYVVDTDEVSTEGLRRAFDDLTGRITTSIGKRRVGAIYCRSSGYKEYSGANESIPILYDEQEPEESWQRFIEAFTRVREFKKVKPVLLQNLIGNIGFEDRYVLRKVHEYTWPGLPSGIQLTNVNLRTAPEFVGQTRDAFLSAMRREGIELPENPESSEDSDKNPKTVSFEFYVENGPHLGDMSACSLWELQSGSPVHSLLSWMDDLLHHDGYSVNQNGEIQDREGRIVVQKGTRIAVGFPERGTDYVIGKTNTAFVARSHDYHEPERAVIKRAWGLTSYLMGSNEKSLELGPMIIDYFDPVTGECRERVNLGHDFRGTLSEEYDQKQYDGFLVRLGRIQRIIMSSRLGRRYPGPVDSEILRIARFYYEKRGVEIEVEGCVKDRQLYVWQITDSPLPKDIIAHLTSVDEKRVLLRVDCGRGALNYRGAIIIKEDNNNENYRRLTEQFKARGEVYLALGFSDEVTGEDHFLYIASEESIAHDARRLTGGNRKGFCQLPEHMKGIACQTTVNAAQQGRHGGMYYLYGSEVDELCRALDRCSDVLDGVKVIQNVHVEACREGLQIYTAS